MKKRMVEIFTNLLFGICRLFPLKDKVVATCFRGRKYGDNPQFIYEYLYGHNDSIEFVWLKSPLYDYDLPSWIRSVPYRYSSIRLIYELSTAKVWINTHRFETLWKKRKGQLVIETWHGGLGLKKIEGDVDRVRNTAWEMAEIKHTCELADVFISQSDHLSSIYRRAFGYKGIIFKCGYPKNDQMFANVMGAKSIVKKKLTIMNDKHILLYAPTMREGDQGADIPNLAPYSIDWDSIYKILKEKFGGDWVICVKWHPVLINKMPKDFIKNSNVLDVSKYQDMQELIKASDIMISDYSSCIFDAALLEIPCFTYATDFEEYKADRGVYYEMEELPFPYSKNNEELQYNILNYDYEQYLKRWSAFKNRTGLYESGHASKDIAEKIMDFIKTGKVEWK
ncbi:MAG: CDP-glycerol glycerophosphotransferase family protein [Paludibacteraceae bacterium]|nr:CDP-glycerol glycerophosphotransferase family protein [Paludibacteraceae bacterium]